MRKFQRLNKAESGVLQVEELTGLSKAQITLSEEGLATLIKAYCRFAVIIISSSCLLVCKSPLLSLRQET